MIVSSLYPNSSVAPDFAVLCLLASHADAFDSQAREQDADVEATLGLLDRQPVPPEVAGSSSRPLTRLERLHWLLDDRRRLEAELIAARQELERRDAA